MATQQTRSRKRQRCNLARVKNVEIGGSIQIRLVMSEQEEYEQDSHKKAQLFPWTGQRVFRVIRYCCWEKIKFLNLTSGK